MHGRCSIDFCTGFLVRNLSLQNQCDPFLQHITSVVSIMFCLKNWYSYLSIWDSYDLFLLQILKNKACPVDRSHESRGRLPMEFEEDQEKGRKEENEENE